MTGLKPSEIAVNSADENFLNKALSIIEENMSDPDFGVEEFAKKIAFKPDPALPKNSRVNRTIRDWIYQNYTA